MDLLLSMVLLIYVTVLINYRQYHKTNVVLSPFGRGAPEGSRLHLLPKEADRGSPPSSRRRRSSLHFAKQNRRKSTSLTGCVFLLWTLPVAVPDKIIGLTLSSILSTAATRSVRFLCHRQHSLRSPRAKNCSPALNFYTSVRTGAAFSSPFQRKKADTRMGICFFGTLEGTRTPDLLVRSQSLYPTELPAHNTFS